MTTGVVELAGLAGSGKTTLADAMRSQDAACTVGVRTGQVERALGLTSAAPALLKARATAPGRWWTPPELRSIAYLHAWQAAVADARGSGIVLLDHGPVFRLAALAGHGPPMVHTRAFRVWWTKTLREWAKTLDAVVWLYARDEILLERINRRDRDHRIRGAEQSTAREFLSRYQAAFDLALVLVEEEGTPVLRVDTSTADAGTLCENVRVSLNDSCAARHP